MGFGTSGSGCNPACLASELRHVRALRRRVRAVVDSLLPRSSRKVVGHSLKVLVGLFGV